MFIYNSNSELYHPPVITIGLMVVNIAVAVLTASTDSVTLNAYELWYGNGIHPIQWITSPFMHANSSHLIGNLTFLWPFGLLVEGKLGWWKFLLLYLAIAVGECALEQVLMLGMDGPGSSEELVISADELAEFSPSEQMMIRDLLGQASSLQPSSLGASSAIFGLLMVCILFAPASDFMVWIRFTTLELPVLVVGGFYVAWEGIQWHMSGFSIGSALLHLLGVLAGAVVGVGFLRWGSPQCDDRDIFNHLWSRSIASKPGNRSSRIKKLRTPKLTSGKLKSKSASPKTAAKSNSPSAGVSTSGPIKKPATSSSSKPSASPMDSPGAKKAIPTDPLVDWLDDSELVGQPSVSTRVHQGDATGAVKELQEMKARAELATIHLSVYVKLYKLCAKGESWRPAALVLQKSLVAHPNNGDARKLQLARLCYVSLKQPESAAKVLKTIRKDQLNPEQISVLAKLLAATEAG